ncbi:hypothetical protein M8C13_06225 [Crossiella sp. SN42]|uniref:hypothetical protein n=1 Tax=Crossiella sp. SN42 TaxID=2944808 RepID=UPI00207D0CCF|nr:hypothetical protein [Crossiella sp. SN42]MCO1575356.1 hypothetical protein [Crossiella sp. SN42]
MNGTQFTAARRSLTRRLLEALAELFTGLGSWRQADADRFTAQAVPLVRAGQATLGQLVAAHLAHEAARALRAPVPVPVLTEHDLVDLREGISDREVYRRPFTTVYAALAQDKPLPEAVEHGRARLVQIAEADLQQTHSRANRAALTGLPAPARPRFWRRELVGEESCALCVLASTQRYRVEDLTPVHPGCDCRVQPIYGRDPGHVLDAARTKRLHAAVAELTGRADPGGRTVDYRQLLVASTAEHGELGTLLVRPRDRFTTRADITKEIPAA